MPDEWILMSEYERVQCFQKFLISFATGGGSDNLDYEMLRKYFLENPETSKLLPDWIRTKRDASQLWEFIKHKFAHYSERREFIWGEFTPLLDYLEHRPDRPADDKISEALLELNK